MRRLISAAVFVVAFHLVATAQSTTTQDPFARFQFLVGSWVGTGEGQPGKSTIERDYQFVLSKKFLRIIHKSTYPPQEKNPKGEVHEELGYLSFDRPQKRFVMRQFYQEGFVALYTLDAQANDQNNFTFESQSIENLPAGWRARETYKKIGPDEFTETFELAAPGKDFEVYSVNSFRRKKS